MSPATRQQFGPYSLNTERDADIIAALEAVDNKIGFVRACVRLAIGLGKANTGELYVVEHAISDDEWALIEKARSGLDARRVRAVD